MAVIFYQVSEIDDETFVAQALSNTPNASIQSIILSKILMQILTFEISVAKKRVQLAKFAQESLRQKFNPYSSFALQLI